MHECSADPADTENLVAYCTRVSNPDNQANHETAPKLLKYLIEHKHWSPFEMVSACVEIETSRAIAAQILRHRSFSFQEFSQRYAVVKPEFEMTKGRKQSSSRKQSSTFDLGDTAVEWFDLAQQALARYCGDLYTKAIEAGIAREQARFLLPLSVQTRMYMQGSLRSWIHYLQLRCSEDTQLEHREVALAIRDCLRPVFPVTMDLVGV